MFMIFMKNGDCIGHTDFIISEEELKDHILIMEDHGYSFVAVDVNKLLDSEIDNISEVVYDWR